MQLSSQLVVFALSIARIQSLPSTDATMLGRSAEALDNRKLTCNGELSPWNPHVATKTTCQDVIDRLYDNEVGGQKAHCFTELSGRNAGSRCCVSWGKNALEGTRYSDFKKVAQGILDDCGFRNGDARYVSGKQAISDINGECISVCLSDRDSGCEQSCL